MSYSLNVLHFKINNIKDCKINDNLTNGFYEVMILSE